ncbi:hypothetical protein ACFYUK_22200 [Nonomuraea wenchangensis]
MTAGPLDDALATLLADRTSELGGAARDVLARCACDLALLLYRGDPGGQDEAVWRAAETVHRELGARLLLPAPAGPAVADGWAALAAELSADPAVRPHCHSPLDGDDPARLAGVLLRLPAAEAERWRTRAAEAFPDVTAGFRPPEGLRDDVGAALGPDALERHRDVAAVISDVLNAIDLDPDLWTPLRQDYQSVHLADEQERERYRSAVLQWVGQLAGASGTSTIDWLVRLDEAVRSVYPQPLPAPGSWWVRLGERSFEALQRNVAEADPRVRLGLIQEGRYGEGESGQRAPTASRNIGIDAGAARRGQILWCLRAWYESPGDGQTPSNRPARVLYGR